MTIDIGRSPDGSGSHASHEGADASSPSVSIPSAHTPGPWKVRQADRNLGIEMERVVLRSGGSMMDWVATVPMHAISGTAERDANAHLIAAAPDLLNACEAMRQRITEAMDLERISPAMALEEMSTIVEAAIAKARGAA